MNPQSIYALGKASVYMLCKMYQRIYGLKIYGAIFFLIMSLQEDQRNMCPKK